MTNRTALLAIAGCLLLAGCGDVIGDDPRVTASTSDEPKSDLAVEAPTISPGGSGTLTIEMRNATSLQVEHIRADTVSVDYDSVSHSPTPRITWTSLPPSWSWNATNVTTTLQVVASADAPRGTYHVTVQATVDGEYRNETATVTVD